MRIFLLLTIAALPATAQAPASQPARLGTITFPTSGAASAQADFITGVLYMHSFEYADAAAAFRTAQAKDPSFAMAYWGEALTFTHPVWNEQNLDSARAVLRKLAPTREARAARAATPRERRWLEAVEILYGEGSKPRRDTLYARAMERLVADHPDDEARTFLALAYLGLNQAVRDVPAYMRAGAIALDVMQRNADHPGAAHYAIHAFDDPTHAPLGLAAARAYSRIAPGAAHAQHMTTHIFLALGMWPDVISQNVVAAGPDRRAWRAGHYTYWLHYGLLQAGRIDEAAQLLDDLHGRDSANVLPRRLSALLLARAQQVITGERWSDPALQWSLGARGASPVAAAVNDFARGFAALGRGDVQEGAAIAEKMRPHATDATSQVPRLLADELAAAVRRARGDRAGAERELRRVAEAAAALPVEFGPPDFVKPPYELLGEWMLSDGRHADAQRAFEMSLALMPGRLLSLRGLERANAALVAASR